jgi:excisionase family DNA binding protein
MPAGMREKLLTKKEVATNLGVSLKTVDRRIMEGKLRAINLSPRCVRIAPSELDKFINNRGGAQ